MAAMSPSVAFLNGFSSHPTELFSGIRGVDASEMEMAASPQHPVFTFSRLLSIIAIRL